MLETLHPIEPGFGDEPCSQDGERQMMFPGAILTSLKLVPPEFSFGILIAAFDQVTMRFPPSHGFQGSLFRGITEHIGGLGGIYTDEEPFLTHRGAID